MARPIPPGWYPGPSGIPGKRYWDGTRWTVEQAATPAPAVHLVLTICTCGLWLPVWLTATLLNRRMARVGPEPGFRGVATGHPVLAGIVVLVGIIFLVADWRAALLLASATAVLCGLVMLAVEAVRSLQRRAQAKAEVAARADDQHWAVLRGEDEWGVFGLKSENEPSPERVKSVRKSGVAAAVIAAGALVYAVTSTVNPRSPDRVPVPVAAPTVTVTRSAVPPLRLPVIQLPPLGFPFLPAPTASPVPTPAAAPVAPVRMGEKAVDGNFTFVVTSVDRSKTLANPNIPFLQATAAGTFLTAHLTITSSGKQPQLFVATDQRLNINGVLYQVDPVAALWTLTIEDVVSPGASDAVVLSFDVPADTPPGGVLELHESSSSSGAAVELLPAK